MRRRNYKSFGDQLFDDLRGPMAIARRSTAATIERKKQQYYDDLSNRLNTDPGLDISSLLDSEISGFRKTLSKGRRMVLIAIALFAVSILPVLAIAEHWVTGESMVALMKVLCVPGFIGTSAASVLFIVYKHPMNIAKMKLRFAEELRHQIRDQQFFKQ